MAQRKHLVGTYNFGRDFWRSSRDYIDSCETFHNCNLIDRISWWNSLENAEDVGTTTHSSKVQSSSLNLFVLSYCANPESSCWVKVQHHHEIFTSNWLIHLIVFQYCCWRVFTSISRKRSQGRKKNVLPNYCILPGNNYSRSMPWNFACHYNQGKELSVRFIERFRLRSIIFSRKMVAILSILHIYYSQQMKAS